tara:strand:+ start:27103 stop:27252 length:150 start_codon:yes stop_codon:yes gene_type:complete
MMSNIVDFCAYKKERDEETEKNFAIWLENNWETGENITVNYTVDVDIDE